MNHPPSQSIVVDRLLYLSRSGSNVLKGNLRTDAEYALEQLHQDASVKKGQHGLGEEGLVVLSGLIGVETNVYEKETSKDAFCDDDASACFELFLTLDKISG